MTWNIEFYKGVDDEIIELPPKVQAKMLRLFDLMQIHGADLGKPHTEALGDGLFEVRAKALEGIARSFFCYLHGKNIMVLRAFVKKTQKTPKKELELARKRMQEVKNELKAVKK
ncbi:MAG: type II toxin-antitoxin system RelE/ParE family toxin [Gammaproteobacteria bacterium]|nr:MAG: type II toxin-antitoxin system RelE/ParE family toxin [Gammaproteobacteria bacterium]UTW43623.1 type II toxin-antitoxin system RelE/ParE family toxin [bacterium SCSIO 12844]